MNSNNKKIYLQPGELVIAEKPTEVSTVLGSCVSVVFYLSRLRMGAMCHAVLPSGDCGNKGKYVDQSITYMLDHFSRLQIDPKEMVVKLFGGASMFPQDSAERVDRAVGAQNIREALSSLRDVGLSPSVSDVGGGRGRKLVFYAHTGEVFLKRVVSPKPLVDRFGRLPFS